MLFYPTLQDILGSLPPDEQAELIVGAAVIGLNIGDEDGNTWPGGEDSAA